MTGPVEDDPNAELLRLIEILSETQQQILKLTEGGVDAVVHASGALLLLPETQTHFRDEAALHQAFAAERNAILDALPLHVALLDENGGIRVVNRAWQAYEHQLDGRPGYRVGETYLNYWKTEAAFGREDAMTIVDKITAVLKGRHPVFTFDYCLRTLPSTPWFQLIVSPLADDHGAVVMHLDITDRKRAEEQQEIRGRLQKLIDEAPLAILVHDAFVPAIANAAFADLFGYASVDDVLGWGDLREGLRLHMSPDLIKRFGQGNGDGAASTRFDCHARRLDGAKLDLDIRLFPLQWRDRQAMCAMISDVTQQNANEQQIRLMQRLDALGQLTGGIAHDFNNLLTVISGNAELLEDSLEGDEPRHSWAELVTSAAEKGAALTNRLLAFARRQALDPKVIDVPDLLAGMTMLLQRTIGTHIAIRIPRDTAKSHVLADPSQLENAILNLCINARDAMPNGGTITITTARAGSGADDTAPLPAELEAGSYVVITVSDTGHGMDAHTLSRAFEPFFTTKEIGKGSGLGLSMVYGFLKQSRGTVTIESHPGKGTDVQLWLPLQPAEMPDTCVRPAAPTLGNGQRILLTEDDDMVRLSVAQQLDSLGYRVRAVATAKEALAVLQEDKDFDLLFTDIVMPGDMKGLDLAETAMRRHAGLRILLTSGYADALDGRVKARFGDSFLAKPYRRDALAALLQKLLKAPAPSV